MNQAMQNNLSLEELETHLYITAPDNPLLPVVRGRLDEFICEAADLADELDDTQERLEEAENVGKGLEEEVDRLESALKLKTSELGEARDTIKNLERGRRYAMQKKPESGAGGGDDAA